MTADEFLSYVAQALFLLIFVHVAREALSQRSRTQIHAALFFGSAAIVVSSSWLVRAIEIEPNRFVSAFTASALLSMPYLLLRLVDDFASVPPPILRAAEIGLAFSVAAVFLVAPLTVVLALALVLIFVAVILYTAYVTGRQSRHTGGVTRRRLQAIAAGSGFLGLMIFTLGLRVALPVFDGIVTDLVQQALSIGAGVSYFLGFATPLILRRAWQEPELREFLGQAARLPRLGNTADIVRELEHGAATSLGAPNASIGLWDESLQGLVFPTSGFEDVSLPSGEMVAGRSFAEQRPLFVRDAMKDDPAHAEIYATYGAKALLAAPITAGKRPIGVLTVFTPRAPIFADEDLQLVTLLADQAAVILESRALIDEAARVQAREEATRLKDDFLSAAAHDLKTPLTVLTMRAQLMERRAKMFPDQPIDMRSIEEIITQAERLRSFVMDLLDAARVESGRLIMNQSEQDLALLADEVCRRYSSTRHTCVVEADGPTIAHVDRTRMSQLLNNLLENAIKYSPRGGEIRVRLWSTNGLAHLTVSDNGIGIPSEDLPHIFDRFHRSGNVDDRRYVGLGLGLYICRGIVEQHGGTINVTSTPNAGTTFHIQLPAAVQEMAHV